MDGEQMPYPIIINKIPIESMIKANMNKRLHL
jgi:hypothetical protein